MTIQKKAEEVVAFLRSQPQQVGHIRLLGIKVLLLDGVNAGKVSTNITQNYRQYQAHLKSDCESILSIWYKHLVPCDSKSVCVEELAEELIKLFQEQTRNDGDLQLLSIKVMLPRGADSDEISAYIAEKYPQYKVLSKKQGIYPIVAIGNI